MSCRSWESEERRSQVKMMLLKGQMVCFRKYVVTHGSRGDAGVPFLAGASMENASWPDWRSSMDRFLVN